MVCFFIKKQFIEKPATSPIFSLTSSETTRKFCNFHKTIYSKIHGKRFMFSNFSFYRNASLSFFFNLENCYFSYAVGTWNLKPNLHPLKGLICELSSFLGFIVGPRASASSNRTPGLIRWDCDSLSFPIIEAQLQFSALADRWSYIVWRPVSPSLLIKNPFFVC